MKNLLQYHQDDEAAGDPRATRLPFGENIPLRDDPVYNDILARYDAAIAAEDDKACDIARRELSALARSRGYVRN